MWNSLCPTYLISKYKAAAESECSHKGSQDQQTKYVNQTYNIIPGWSMPGLTTIVIGAVHQQGVGRNLTTVWLDVDK